MSEEVEVGKRYIATNTDGVQIIGVVSKKVGGRIEFGNRATVFVLMHGWTFEEAPEPNKIFMVEHGSYSDYNVDGIFTTRDRAETFAERLNLKKHAQYDESVVEEKDLNPEQPMPTLKYLVYITGRPEPIFTHAREATYADTYVHCFFTETPGWGGPAGWHGTATGDTPEQAMKSAQDLVAQEKARMAGL